MNGNQRHIEQAYNRWQRQPLDEIEQTEMEREMREAEAADDKHNTLGEWSNSDDERVWDVEENVQTGRGRNRKSDEANDDADTSTPVEKPFVIENRKQVKSKKFRMTAMDYTVRFNNAEDDLDLLDGYERVQEIFENLLGDITAGMNEKDQVRFVLRSTQLDTPISLPFMAVQQLTPEHIFSQVERVIQSNRDFRLNDTVMVDIVHVEAP